MPLNGSYIAPGLWHEVWEGTMTAAELSASQERFVLYISKEALPNNIIIVEVKPGTRVPLSAA